MTYAVTVRYRSGRPTVKCEKYSWGEINDYVKELAVGLGEAFPWGTVMTVQHGLAVLKFSIRGGGDKPVTLIKLTDKITGAISGGKSDAGLLPDLQNLT